MYDKNSWKVLMAGGMLLAGGPAMADEATDAKIQALENKLQQMEQQRQQQEWQMKAMAEELKAIQQAKADEKGKSKGQPVYAAFKDGVKFEDGSGIWQLAINGRVQADARAFDPDEAAGDTFSVRRARLGATMTFYQDYSARVEGEYSGSSTTLTYAYFDINKYKAAKLRMGQFKPFYGLERSMSTRFTDFQERSFADALLGGTYDRGIMLHGAPVNGLYYSVAYINGNGTGDDKDVQYDNKDWMGHVTGNIAQFAGWKDAVVHLGGFYAHGKQEAGSSIPAVQTEARGYKFFETDNSNKFIKPVNRTRSGGELALAYGPVKFQSEYIRASFDGHGFDRDLSSWYASVNWLVTGESFAGIYKDGIFGRIRPKADYQSGGDGWGALEVGLRYSNFDGGDFTTTNAAGTGKLAAKKTNDADAWTLGANWILNPNVRLVANYVHTKFDMPVTVKGKKFDDEDAVTLRAQFDF